MRSIEFKNQQLTPSKIVCVGRNYLEHINELNNEVPQNMVLFLKPNSAISQTLHSQHCVNDVPETLHYEAEICFMYQHNTLSAVGIGLDLTKRSLQALLKNKGLPWERAKAFDGSAVFSEFVAISSIDSPLELKLYIDQQLTQHAKYEHMIYKPSDILKEVQQFMALENGDIIMTGTPAGVGQIKQGATFNCQLYLNDNLLVDKKWLAI
jgi:2-keto-4-pentenoate hydratase/2-oxohepta-3-ene-1,7-dioic acid hydratase in catechol pathway